MKIDKEVLSALRFFLIVMLVCAAVSGVCFYFNEPINGTLYLAGSFMQLGPIGMALYIIWRDRSKNE